MSVFDSVEAATSNSEVSEGSNPTFDDLMEMSSTPAESTPTYEVSKTEGIEDLVNEHIKNANSETGEDKKGRDEETGEVDPPAELKMLKASLSENEYDIPADAQLTAIIDGQETPVSVQELLNNYSGKVAYDKKFQELGTSRKEFTAQKEQHEKVVNTFMSHMEEGKVNEALMLLGQQAGKNPYEFMIELRNGFLEQNQLLNTLSPEQREAFLAKEEAEYLRQQNESILSQKSEQENLQGLQNSLMKLQETQGIDDEGLTSAWEKLLTTTNGNVVELLEKFGGQAGVVETLGKFVTTEKAYERCFSAVEDYKEVIDSQEMNGVIENLVDAVLKDSSITDDEISTWLAEAFSSRKASKQISEKAKKANKVVPQAKPKKEVENYFDFDEL